MALVRPHEEPLPWLMPAALQMIWKTMKALQTVACAIALAVPLVVVAQANPPDNRSSDRAASQLSYKSAFEDYKPYVDIPVADWRQVNNTVRDAAAKGGGHGGHDAPDSKGLAGSASDKEAAPPAATPQHPMGHEMPGGKHIQGGPEPHGSMKGPEAHEMHVAQGDHGGQQ